MNVHIQLIHEKMTFVKIFFGTKIRGFYMIKDIDFHADI